jgi:hypothetical protein
MAAILSDDWAPSTAVDNVDGKKFSTFATQENNTSSLAVEFTQDIKKNPSTEEAEEDDVCSHDTYGMIKIIDDNENPPFSLDSLNPLPLLSKVGESLKESLNPLPLLSKAGSKVGEGIDSTILAFYGTIEAASEAICGIGAPVGLTDDEKRDWNPQIDGWKQTVKDVDGALTQTVKSIGEVVTKKLISSDALETLDVSASYNHDDTTIDVNSTLDSRNDEESKLNGSTSDQRSIEADERNTNDQAINKEEIDKSSTTKSWPAFDQTMIKVSEAMAASTQQLLEQKVLLNGAPEEIQQDFYDAVSRTALLSAEVTAKHAELELKRIQLESLALQDQMQRLSGDTFDSTDDSMMPENNGYLFLCCREKSVVKESTPSIASASASASIKTEIFGQTTTLDAQPGCGFLAFLGLDKPELDDIIDVDTEESSLDSMPGPRSPKVQALMDEIEEMKASCLNSYAKLEPPTEETTVTESEALTTRKQQLLLEQNEFLTGAPEETKKNYYKAVSCSAMLNAEVIERQAELDLQKIQLESLQVEAQMQQLVGDNDSSHDSHVPEKRNTMFRSFLGKVRTKKTKGAGKKNNIKARIAAE